MIRSLKLVNKNGSEKYLNDLNLFAINPEGLGISFSNEYINFGTVFDDIATVLNQNQISFTILFGAINNDPYIEFMRLTEFLNFPPLELIYTTNAGEYRRIVKLSELTKTEIKEDGMQSNMILETITPWYYYFENSDDYFDDAPISFDKIYLKTSDTPSENKNILPDSVIESISETSGNWVTEGSAEAYEISSSDDYKPLYNMLSIDQSKIIDENLSDNSRFLNANNIDVSDQSTKTLLLSLYFKSDKILDTVNDLEIESFDTNGVLLTPSNILDEFGTIQNSKAIYSVLSQNQGNWLHFMIAYQVNSSALARIRFNFSNKNSLKNYLTSPCLYILESGDNSSNYYVNPYIYGTRETDAHKDYFVLQNDSRYFELNTSSPIEITVTPTDENIVNPSWDLMVGSNIIASDRYFLTLYKNQKLVVSSFPEDQYARVYNQDDTYQNVYQKQDITKTNFIEIPGGKSTLYFDIGDAKASFKMRVERLIV